MCVFSLFSLFTVINSTYQSGDINSSGTEEDVLYQSDALFSAKLDNSHSHNNNNNLNKSNHKSVSNGDNSSRSSVNKLNRNYDKNNNNDNKSSREIIVKKSNNISNNTKQKNQTNSKVELATIGSKSTLTTSKKSGKKPTNQHNNVHAGPSEPIMEIIKTNDWSKVPTNPMEINVSNDNGYDNDDFNADTDSGT